MPGTLLLFHFYNIFGHIEDQIKSIFYIKLQTLGFSPGDRDHLDNFLVTAFQRNVPQNFSLLQTVGITHHSRSHSSKF